jgi:hypothetical protein
MDRQFLKVEGNDGLVRDTSNKAVINTNAGEYQRYIRQRDEALQRQQMIQQNADDIASLKNDMADIKTLLLQIINK